MAKLKLTEVEFAQFAHKLKRMRDAKHTRPKEQLNLIKETANKFDAGQLSFGTTEIEVPLQRRHLRLLEEMQLLTLHILESTTVPELKKRLEAHPDKEAYYKEQLAKADELKIQTAAVLEKIKAFL